jgi:RNA polymerase sigma-70 factor (ECF subfamily)
MDDVISSMPDERLIMATLQGDDDAFARLIARYKRRVFSLSARFARDGDELEDICQEVFIKVYENLKGFRNDAPFENWLTRITVRTCYDTLRRNRRTRNHTPLHDLPFEVRDHSIEARQEAWQAHELLTWALAKLLPDERLVITLLELEEKTVREVAALTSWSEGNVKVRAHRARKELRRILEESHER